MKFSQAMLDEYVHRPGGMPQEVFAIIEELRRLQSLQLPPAKDWGPGIPDGWSWVRRKLERCAPELIGNPERLDRYKGTPYEVMGWMHCIVHDAVAGYRTYLGIAVEQQKRAEEAEAKLVRHRHTDECLSCAAENGHAHCIAECRDSREGNAQ